MRVFVTGGTGFIGSHFINAALSADYEVIALRRHGSKPVITLKEQPSWIELPLDRVPSDQLEGCDALVHFAAQGVSPQPTDWRQAFNINVTQSISLFAAAEKAGIPHLITCGSCFEYGKSGERYDFIPTNAPLEPTGPYATSKAAFSLTIEAMARTSPSAFSILRPFHLFGEGQHHSNFWPSLRNAAQLGKDFPMSPGDQIRDYMPVEAVVEQFLLRLYDVPPIGQVRVSNIGSGCPMSLKQFASSWWDQWQSSGNLKIGAIPYRPGEIMRFVPSLK